MQQDVDVASRALQHTLAYLLTLARQRRIPLAYATKRRQLRPMHWIVLGYSLAACVSHVGRATIEQLNRSSAWRVSRQGHVDAGRHQHTASFRTGCAIDYAALERCVAARPMRASPTAIVHMFDGQETGIAANCVRRFPGRYRARRSWRSGVHFRTGNAVNK